MSNFLSRIAARALGVAHVAQPLVPSMFNPGVGFESSQPASEIAVEKLSAPATTLESPAEASLPRQWESPLAAHHLPVEDREVQEHTHPTALPFSEPQVESAPTGLSSREIRPAIQNALPSASNAIGLRPERTGRRTEAADGVPELNHANLAEPDLVPNSFRSNRQSVRTLNIKPAPLVTPLVSSQNNAARRGQERPLVRVTIGRIDVRAQFASQAAPHSASMQQRPATLSLDEYLKQRSEGKR